MANLKVGNQVVFKEYYAVGLAFIEEDIIYLILRGLYAGWDQDIENRALTLRASEKKLFISLFHWKPSGY